MRFSELSLIPPLVRAVANEGYTEPTPIQAKAIPPILDGKDLVGIAQTGTGKTAAFVLPLLQRLDKKERRTPKSPRALILAPTRELAAQINESIATYGRYLTVKHAVIFGGVGQGAQVKALQNGVDALVATPGRLLDLLFQRHVRLSNVEYFVLDEADRMLDMGFINDIKKLLRFLPPTKQTLFFSATMPQTVNALAKALLHDPVKVAVAPQATTVEQVEQRVFYVNQQEKDALLLTLLHKEKLNRVLIFTRTKRRADKLARRLSKHGVKAGAIHGDKSQGARTQALKNFRVGRSPVLVATDIAARGIDIEEISHVINYDLPNEPENYVHRIGRTARAGAEGTAYSFCAADEKSYLHAIERLTKEQITVAEHLFHSDEAMHATGAAARPKARQQTPRRRRAPKNVVTPRRAPAKKGFAGKGTGRRLKGYSPARKQRSKSTGPRGGASGGKSRPRKRKRR